MRLGLLGVQSVQRFAAVGRDDHLPAFADEQPPHHLAGVQIVLDDEHARRLRQVLKRSSSWASCARSTGFVKYPEAPRVNPFLLLVGDRHHDDRYAAQLRVLLDRLKNAPAIHVRHEYVERDHRGMQFARKLEPFPPAAGGDHVEALAA